MSAPPKAGVDWERIEVQYRAGLLSIRAIAEEHGVSDAAIRQKAKKFGWERDLSAKVAAKVRTALVRTDASRPDHRASAQTEREVVEEAAATRIGIVRSHRKDITKARTLTDTLLEQLTLAAGSRDVFQGAIEDMTADDTTPTRYNALMRAVSLPVHIGAAKDLGQAMRHLIALERQAFGLADVDDPTPPEVSTEKDPVQMAIEAARARQKARLAPPTDNPSPSDALSKATA